MLARLRAAQLLTEAGIEASLVGSIHDSIVADTPSKNIEIVGKIFKQSIEEIPQYCKKVWGYSFGLPMTGEVSVGKNKTDMELLVM